MMSDVMSLAHERASVAHLKAFGYAPGAYMTRCIDCTSIAPPSYASKQSWRCEAHAQTAYEQSRFIRTPEAFEPTIDEALCKPVHGRKGHFMRLASGTRYWPLDPRPEEVFIDDIASSLSKICRFNGHVEGDAVYSVAEHSYWCSYRVPQDDALEALLHDASEAFTGDMIRPLKIIPAIAAVYKPIEELNERAIARRFGLRFPYPASVKLADEALCTRELRTIMAGREERAEDQAVCNTTREANVTLQCWAPREAKAWFLQRFFQLVSERRDWHKPFPEFLSPAGRRVHR